MGNALAQSLPQRLRKAAHWLEGLSLDALLVALAWGHALAAEAGVRLAAGPALVLVLATWLTYAGDRLLDTLPGRPVPDSARHRFCRRNWRLIAAAWLVLLPLSILLAAWTLPGWQFAGGWVLVFVVIIYYILLQLPAPRSTRLLLKRSLVPIIFTAGVAWMARAWLDPRALGGTALLLLGSAGNVLLISETENRGQPDRPAWLGRSVTLVVVLLFLMAAALFRALPATALAALSIALFLSILRHCARSWPATGVRLLADAALLVAAGFLLAGGL